MSVISLNPQEWAFVLDKMTPVADDAAWAWRHRICNRMWGW